MEFAATQNKVRLRGLKTCTLSETNLSRFYLINQSEINSQVAAISISLNWVSSNLEYRTL